MKPDPETSEALARLQNQGTFQRLVRFLEEQEQREVNRALYALERSQADVARGRAQMLSEVRSLLGNSPGRGKQ